jgi:hypothetical protein
MRLPCIGMELEFATFESNTEPWLDCHHSTTVFENFNNVENQFRLFQTEDQYLIGYPSLVTDLERLRYHRNPTFLRTSMDV